MSQKNSPLVGKSIAFFGTFSFFPGYHKASPSQLAVRHGAIVVKRVTDELDYLVIADRRGTGRAAARKSGLRIQKRQIEATGPSGDSEPRLKIIDEAEFRDMVRREVTGKSFAFCGGFDCCPNEMRDVLQGMVTAIGGVFTERIDENLDFLVTGNRRGKGKAAAMKAGEQLAAAGGGIELINETIFRELVRVEGATRPTETVPEDFIF